jgi:hypothetical protein
MPQRKVSDGSLSACDVRIGAVRARTLNIRRAYPCCRMRVNGHPQHRGCPPIGATCSRRFPHCAVKYNVGRVDWIPHVGLVVERVLAYVEASSRNTERRLAA